MILALDTSTESCTAAIFRETLCIATVQTNLPNIHGQQLLKSIDFLLSSVQCKKSELSALACTIGPGSYTGLRIGLSTIKGLALGLELPIFAFNTLETLAACYEENAQNAQALRVSMLDAGRNEVYMAIYDLKGTEIFAPKPVCIDAIDFDELLSEKNVLFVGNGAAKAKKLLKPQSNWLFLTEIPTLTNGLAALCQNSEPLKANERAYLTPLYLKEGNFKKANILFEHF